MSQKYSFIAPSTGKSVVSRNSFRTTNTKEDSFESNSLWWLESNYIWKKGLRKWKWRVVLEGIIIEHERFLKKQGSIKNELKHVELIWNTLFNVLAIDLDTVPKTSDPDHKDVKTCLFIYSMESFLYKRIN